MNRNTAAINLQVSPVVANTFRLAAIREKTTLRAIFEAAILAYTSRKRGNPKNQVSRGK